MRYVRTHHRLAATLSAILLALVLQACMHWRPVTLDPASLPARGRVRATLHNGERVIIEAPVIVKDTLRSAAPGSPRTPPRSGIPLAAIVRLEAYESDGAATVALVVGGAVLIAAIVLVLGSLDIDTDTGCFPACN